MIVIKDTQITYYPKRAIIYENYTLLLINETIQFYNSKNQEEVSIMQKGIKDLCVLKKEIKNEIKIKNKIYKQFILLKYDMKIEMVLLKECKLIKLCKLEFSNIIKEWSYCSEIIYLNTEQGSYIINIINDNQLVAKSIQIFNNPLNLQITKLTEKIYIFQYLNIFNLTRYSYNSNKNILKIQELFKTNAIKLFYSKEIVLSIFSNSINIILNNSNLKNFDIKMPSNLFLFNIFIIELKLNIFRIFNGDGTIIEINIKTKIIEFIFIEKLNCFGLKKSHDVIMKKVRINEYKRIIKGISESIKPIINSNNKFYKSVIYENNKIIIITNSVFIIKIKKDIEIIKEIPNTMKIKDIDIYYKNSIEKEIFIAFNNSIIKIKKNFIKENLILNIYILKIFSTKNSLLINYKKEEKEGIVLFYKNSFYEFIDISLINDDLKNIINIWEINNFLIIYLNNNLLIFNIKNIINFNYKLYKNSNNKLIKEILNINENILIKYFNGESLIFKNFEDFEKEIIYKLIIKEDIIKYKDILVILKNNKLFFIKESLFKEDILINEKGWDFSKLPIIINKEEESYLNNNLIIKSFNFIEIKEIKNNKRNSRELLILITEYQIIIYEKIKNTFYKKFQLIGKEYKEINKENKTIALLIYPNMIIFNTRNGLILKELNINENELHNINENIIKNFNNFFNIKFQDVNNLNLLSLKYNKINILQIEDIEIPLINIKQNKSIEFIKTSDEFICIVTSKKDKIEFPAEESSSNNLTQENEIKEDNTIRKSTNLTIMKRYSIQIYKRNELNIKKIGSIKFKRNEIITDLKLKKGFQTDNFQDVPIINFLYLTSTRNIGRNLQSIGIIYLYNPETLELKYKEENDVVIKSINVFDFPIQPMKSYNLLNEFNTNPQNTSNINHFFDTTNRNLLAVGCGDQLKIYNSHPQFMEPIAFYDLNQLIERIYCLKNYIIVFDRKMGVHLFLLQLEPIQLHLLSSSNLPVESLLINFESKTFLKTINKLNEKNILLNKLYIEIEEEKEIYFIVKHLLNSSLNILTYSPKNIFGNELILRDSYEINSNIFCKGNIMFSFNSFFETCEYKFIKEDKQFYIFDKFFELLLLKKEGDLNLLNGFQIKNIEANKIILIESKVLRYFLMSNENYKNSICNICNIEYSEAISLLWRILSIN